MNFTSTLKMHWPEFLMEAWGLGMFMVSACLFTALLEYPDSPVHQLIPVPFVRHVLIGLAMGGTLIAIVHSSWGKRSGAHLNPSFTWTFFRLRKIAFWDAFFYTFAQFIGAILGVAFAALFFGMYVRHPSVHYAATLPGPDGPIVAFVAEVVISFILMSTVLVVSNHPTWNRFTAFFAAFLVATYITFEGPLSGMSMNPARTFGSAIAASEWNSLWIYFLAPPIGMLMAGELYRGLKGLDLVYCAKFHHQNNERCIFQCNFGDLAAKENAPNSAIL
jgi:aquaporin Z